MCGGPLDGSYLPVPQEAADSDFVIVLAWPYNAKAPMAAPVGTPVDVLGHAFALARAAHVSDMRPWAIECQRLNGRASALYCGVANHGRACCMPAHWLLMQWSGEVHER
jgi:hypothetical protein